MTYTSNNAAALAEASEALAKRVQTYVRGKANIYDVLDFIDKTKSIITEADTEALDAMAQLNGLHVGSLYLQLHEGARLKVTITKLLDTIAEDFKNKDFDAAKELAKTLSYVAQNFSAIYYSDFDVIYAAPPELANRLPRSAFQVAKLSLGLSSSYLISVYLTDADAEVRDVIIWIMSRANSAQVTLQLIRKVRAYVPGAFTCGRGIGNTSFTICGMHTSEEVVGAVKGIMEFINDVVVPQVISILAGRH